MTMGDTLLRTARDLADGRTTSLALTEAALARAKDSSGEGPRVFLTLLDATAIFEARRSDELRAEGVVPSLLAGIPVSVKDLFDIAGAVTTAGSTILRSQAPSRTDATIVGRLRAAGAIIIGKTNLTEFAYSGLGINPHYGTPRNTWARIGKGRVPGGSSSGAAISVTDGMAVAAIGTDTGGSVRIPAAANGLVGFKPTQSRVPRDGSIPLSPTLDSVGPIGRSVSCCQIVDCILNGSSPAVMSVPPISEFNFLLPTSSHLFNQLDVHVATLFERAVDRLVAAGAKIVEREIPEFDQIRQLNASGGIAAAECFAWHRQSLNAFYDQYDPMVAARIQRGSEISRSEYLALLRKREELMSRMRMAGLDGWLAPTLPCLPPEIGALEHDEVAYGGANSLMLRNTSVVNFLDGCALTIPCHEVGQAPVGLMLAGCAGNDSRILAAGLAIEDILSA